MVQSLEELEKWHSNQDPWFYKDTPDDLNRREILRGVIPERRYKQVLDIGCGQGFITQILPGENILGIDISNEAIQKAKKHESNTCKFQQNSIFDFEPKDKKYDLIIITGVLYEQYIGKSLCLIYDYINSWLNIDGVLISVHIDEWYDAKFPFFTYRSLYYKYRNYTHKLEVYIK